VVKQICGVKRNTNALDAGFIRRLKPIRMLIKNLEQPKRTLRERIYEEIVHLIISGELPSGGWVDEKQIIDKLRVSRTPFREAIGILAKGGLVEIKPYRGFYVRSFSRKETADIYALFKRLECFAVELAIPLMSDRDITGVENILMASVVALQRGDMKTYAVRDREFYENIAEQSGNSALIEALARVALQMQVCGTITSVGREFAERATHGCDNIIHAFETRDIPHAAVLVGGRIALTLEAILARFPNETASR
jgi:DNA-binding GntR family transcriptional regulator